MLFEPLECSVAYLAVLLFPTLVSLPAHVDAQHGAD
jgi:hypothetical protein